jgi:hypothetical protein
LRANEISSRRYADRAKAIKVKASAVNASTTTTAAAPSQPGSQTPMHQLRQKLGDTEASRERLEEEARDLFFLFFFLS